jgi:murein DD-endopeptidase MepM/ murein hydrolase activator NlpD
MDDSSGKIRIKQVRRKAASAPRVSPPRPPRKNKGFGQKQLVILLGALALILVLVGVFYLGKKSVAPEEEPPVDPVTPTETEEIVHDDQFWHLPLDLSEYEVETDIITADQQIPQFLQEQWNDARPWSAIHQEALERGLTTIEMGWDFYRASTPEVDGALLILKASPGMIYLFKKEEETLEVIERDVEVRTVVKSGILRDDLWKATSDADIHYSAIPLLEDAFKWTIDFHHLEPGDRFKLVLEEEWVAGEFAGISRLKAAWFEVGEETYQAFSAEVDGTLEYFDRFGRSMRKPFLVAPVEYTRISRGYSAEETLHPVDNVMRAHYGTDYAAPEGTEIVAVADGVVIKRDYTSGNGNYVKLEHTDNIQTQYLHMSRFADNLKRGDRVKQGQVIGYVGQTGKATGPHVCFRFWKGGKQVDHTKELPNSGINTFPDLDDFLIHQESLQLIMEEVPFY